MSTRIRLAAVLLLVPMLLFGATRGASGQKTAATVRVDSEVVLAALEKSHPGIRIRRYGDLITKVYGKPMSFLAKSPVSSAEAFRLEHSGIFGLASDELVLEAIDPDRHELSTPLVYQPKTKRYRFELIRYTQRRAGVPVYGSELRLLVGLVPGFPVLSASSTLRDLGDFEPKMMDAKLNRDRARKAVSHFVQLNFVGEELRAEESDLEYFSKPELVIWAGVEGNTPPPRLAVSFVAGRRGGARSSLKPGQKPGPKPTSAGPRSWRFIADASTGRILHMESLIYFLDLAGSVEGKVTEGVAAAACAEEVPTPFPYVEVGYPGDGSVFADAGAAFTIPNSGSDPITLSAASDGEFFDVFVSERHGPLGERIQTSAAPPGPVKIVFNATNTNEIARAAANAYVSANEARDWVLTYNPAYPVIAAERDFNVVVGVAHPGLCAGAYYDLLDPSILFCVAIPEDYSDVYLMAGYRDSAFRPIVHHEYGHHVVESASTLVGFEYHQGMADIIPMLISGDADIGVGFRDDDCTNVLRSADNNCQKIPGGCTCGTTEGCASLFSGIIWDIREELAITEPADYADIISSLVVNSIPINTGWGIDVNIAIDLLTLDDDDGDFDNGSPHREEICTAFAMHGITCPDAITTCDTDPDCNDGQFCTGLNRCAQGYCVSLAPPPCAGYDEVPYCDESSNRCVECLQDVDCEAQSGCVQSAVCEANVCSCSCTVDADCNDGAYCNGVEECVGGRCQAGDSPCDTGWNSSGACDEATDTCVNCIDHQDCSIECGTPGTGMCLEGECLCWWPCSTYCDDGLFCNGPEACVNDSCEFGTNDPCPGLDCNEGLDECIPECLADEHCNNGLFCDGKEYCSNGRCLDRSDSCPPWAQCSESSQECVYECEEDSICNNGTYCDGAERCSADGRCLDGTPPCGPPTVCEEDLNTCLGPCTDLPYLSVDFSSMPNGFETTGNVAIVDPTKGPRGSLLGSMVELRTASWRWNWLRLWPWEYYWSRPGLRASASSITTRPIDPGSATEVELRYWLDVSELATTGFVEISARRVVASGLAMTWILIERINGNDTDPWTRTHNIQNPRLLSGPFQIRWSVYSAIRSDTVVRLDTIRVSGVQCQSP